jgi:2'-5' RNA ligase
MGAAGARAGLGRGRLNRARIGQMEVTNGLGLGINSFALVSYLSGALADFLDEIRHDFAPDSRAKAHVTVLPPRPLRLPPKAAVVENAWTELKNHLSDFQPFRVELGDVEVFRLNRVIYLSVQAGGGELQRMHDALNTGLIEFQEPFPYHPHVTIVQELQPDDVPQAAELSRCRWSEFRTPRSFMVDRLTFVQNVIVPHMAENSWTDLAALDLVGSVTR